MELGATTPKAGVTVAQAFVMEAVLTTGLVNTILGTASGARDIGTNVIDRVGPKKAHKLLAQAKNRNASVCCRRVGPQSPRGAIVRGNERAAQRRPLSPYFLGVVIAPFR
jgi:hypothetical protein